MNVRRSGFSTVVFAMAVVTSVAAVPSRGHAQTNEELLQRVLVLERTLEGMKHLERELEDLKRQLNSTVTATREAEEKAKAAEEQAQAAEKQAQAVERQVQSVEQHARTMEKAGVKWHLAGYASSGFRTSDKSDEEDTFLVGTFNPIFHFQYKDLILFEGEVMFTTNSDGTTATELEYAQLDLLVHDNASFVAGKFLNPVGQFQERLHPAWINKLPDAPAGFGHGGVQPGSEVGVMVRGGFEPGPIPLVNYAIFGGNGPRLEFAGELEGLELEGFGSDDNGDKSVGGRIGIVPIPHLEIGGSFMTADLAGVPGTSGPVTDGEYTLWGVDAAYTRGPWDVRFEYLWSELTSFFSQKEAGEPTELIPTTEWNAWYAQVAYQLADLTSARFLRNLEPVVRYGQVDVEGFAHFVEHTVPEDRLTIGLNYLFAPSVIAKLAVSRRDFDDPDAEDAIEVRGQLAFGF